MFYPFHLKWRSIIVDDIVSFEMVTYRPFRDYGGWGIRRGRKGVWAYTMSGNRGIRIEKKDGKKLLFGSQQPNTFADAVRTIINS